jgi:hypothetical protein
VLTTLPLLALLASSAAAQPPAQRLACGTRFRCASDTAFLVDVAVPEGDYDVTVTLGDPTRAATTWVKAEARSRGAHDASHRDPLDRFDLPASPFSNTTKPAGS